jgi:hypothetical protein
VNQYQTGTYAGTFANSGSGAFNLVKSQAGTLVLAGNSSNWTKGSATISAGTVLISSNNALGQAAVTGTLGSATLASSADGLGILNTIITTSTASVINPAASGTFTVGSLTATNGITLSLTPGSALAMNGNLIGASGAGTFILDLSGGFATGTPVTIMNFGSQSGVDASDFALSAAASSLYSLSSVGIEANSVDITLLAVPEPCDMVLLLCGCTILIGSARLRVRKTASPDAGISA